MAFWERGGLSSSSKEQLEAAMVARIVEKVRAICTVAACGAESSKYLGAGNGGLALQR